MRRLTLGAAALVSVSFLTSCLPRPQAFDPNRLPDPADLSSRNAATEWYYVSGYLPESGLAFHWAQFKVNYRGIPYNAGHLAVADLRAGKLNLYENTSQSVRFGFPPLRVEQGNWRLVQGAGSRAFGLQAGPLNLTLTSTLR